jgi:PAS domain S-box-containing protein
MENRNNKQTIPPSAAIAEELQKTFDANLDAIWILDKNQQIVRCNKMAQQVFNLFPSEMIGRHCWEIMHGSEQSIPDCPALRVQHTLSRESNELRINHRCFTAYIEPILDENERISGYVHIVRDISELKQTEKLLRDSEEKYRLLFEGSAHGVLAADIQTEQFVLANPSICRMLGYSEAELLHLCIADIHPKESLDFVRSEFKAMVRHEKMTSSSLPCVRKDGTVIYADISASDSSINGQRCLVGFFTDTTVRKLTEDSLQETSERFSKAFKTSPYAYMIAHMDDGTIVDVNDAFVNVSGFTREEALASTTIKLNLWISKEHRQQMVATLHNGQDVVGMETRLLAKNGSIRTVLLSAQIIQLGHRNCILSIVEDITNRKQMEEALQESEQRYRMVSELSTDYVFKLGIATDGKVTMDFVSENFYVLTGRTREDIVTVESWSTIVHPDDVGKVMGLLGTMISTPQSTEIECRSYIHGNNLRWINIVAKSEFDKKANRVTAITGAVKDISGRKQAEMALLASESKYRDLANSVPVGIFEAGLDGSLSFANKTLYDWYGYTKEDFESGMTVFDMLDSKDHSNARENLSKVFSSSPSQPNEYSAVRKDGSVMQILVVARPIVAHGKPEGIRGIILDLTEKKKMESVLQNTARLESLGVLAGGIAHDFNNLLTGIYGYMDLARAVSKDSQIAEFLEGMFATMNRAKALTLQLLTFAKGGSPVQRLTSLIPFLQETAQFALSGSNSSCRFNLQKDLWYCNIDKNQIAQVIDNIVINALQAMPGGGTIDICAKNSLFAEREHSQLAKGDYVKISITDTGIGIPENILPRIFDPFYTTKIKGHGLGLATCYSIVKRHGGGIEVESEPGKGSTFHVYLPASSSETVTLLATLGTTHKGSGTIIIADDEEIVRKAFQQMLELIGYAVVCKSDGREVVDFLKNESCKGPFAAIILDLTIPGGMGGLEAIAEIRKLESELPVFVTSGYADNSVMKDPAAYGFTASLSKPFTIAELSEMLESNVSAKSTI